ncbi:MAG TPA: NUDIX domain-containing protein [Jatrophihabitantaceae bacterium]|nr:NUDIX domain-containing protein [Jatrophihabitantaceae bacterium]
MVDPLTELLSDYRPRGAAEIADLARIRDLVQAVDDPWSRVNPLHVTASAVIVHPASKRVLLRWHARQQAWLQVGGHGDPGETDPTDIARREGAEETGLPDLALWPDESQRHLVHAVIVSVPAKREDPAHQHADLRFVLATDSPQDARPERPDAPLRWLTFAEAHDTTAEDNLRETLSRVERLINS